jgi:gluconolactonase
MKVDLAGNVYATGPGGVLVIAPDGKHLGTIRPPEALTNVGWGEDGRTLYITGRTALYRIRLSARGAI